MATIKPKRGTSTPGIGAILQNELAVDTTNKRLFIGAADGSGVLIGSAPGGSDTQVQFNDGGSAFGGDSGLTYNKSTDSLTIAGDLAINGGDLTSSASTFNLFSTGTASTTLNIATNSVGASNTKTLNIGTGGAGSSTTAINLGSVLGTSTISINGNVSQTGYYYELLSGEGIKFGFAKGMMGVFLKSQMMDTVTLAIDASENGGAIQINGTDANDATNGYINCLTPLFKAGDIEGNNNGHYIELDDLNGTFEVGASIVMVANPSYIQFVDGSRQATSTPDYLLFNMGIAIIHIME